MLPLYFRKTPGNISDVSTIKNLIKDIDYISNKKISLIMDRGFYSKQNVEEMIKNSFKFIIGTKTHISYVRNEIELVKDKIEDFTNYFDEYNLYALSKTISYKLDEKHFEKVNLHIYFSPDKQLDQHMLLNNKLATLKQEIESGKIKIENQGQYSKYFSVYSSGNKVKVDIIQEAIDKKRGTHGFFAMLSNAEKDPIKALELYKMKDLIEKAFENLKDRLSFKRMLVSNEKTLDGKLFVEIVALTIMSYIKKKMQERKMFKKFTMQQMLDEIDVIECFEKVGRKPYYSEVTKKQKDIFEAMGVPPPYSL
jgi:transposase